MNVSLQYQDATNGTTTKPQTHRLQHTTTNTCVGTVDPNYGPSANRAAGRALFPSTLRTPKVAKIDPPRVAECQKKLLPQRLLELFIVLVTSHNEPVLVRKVLLRQFQGRQGQKSAGATFALVSIPSSQSWAITRAGATFSLKSKDTNFSVFNTKKHAFDLGIM